MKTSIFLLFFLGFSFILLAQNEQKKEFSIQDSVGQHQYDSLLKISPEIKELLEKNYTQKIPFLQPDTSPFSHNLYPDPYRMPILGQGIRFNSNMPVYVPDSTVHYYLKILGPHKSIKKKN